MFMCKLPYIFSKKEKLHHFQQIVDMIRTLKHNQNLGNYISQLINIFLLFSEDESDSTIRMKCKYISDV